MGLEPGAFWKASVGNKRKHTEKHTLQTQQPAHKQIRQIGAELSVCVSHMRLKFCIIVGYEEGSLGEIVIIFEPYFSCEENLFAAHEVQYVQLLLAFGAAARSK